MLPVTQASLVSKMGDHGERDRIPADLRTYIRVEYNGDGAEVRRMLAETRRRAPRGNGTRQRRGILSALFEALESAIPRPGGV